MATSTVTQTAPKCFRAHLHDTEIVLTKVDDRIVIVTPVGEFLRYFEIDDATFCTVLGEIGIADTQALMDTWHGGYAKIACSRLQEVA
jgi:hypothetical protein